MGLRPAFLLGPGSAPRDGGGSRKRIHFDRGKLLHFRREWRRRDAVDCAQAPGHGADRAETGARQP